MVNYIWSVDVRWRAHRLFPHNDRNELTSGTVFDERKVLLSVVSLRTLCNNIQPTATGSSKIITLGFILHEPLWRAL